MHRKPLFHTIARGLRFFVAGDASAASQDPGQAISFRYATFLPDSGRDRRPFAASYKRTWGNRAKSCRRGWRLPGKVGIRWMLPEIHHRGAAISSKRASESRGCFCCSPRLCAFVVQISGLSNSPAAPVCRRGFREPDATRKHLVHPIALTRDPRGRLHRRISC
jgi:hypothetical protein